MKEDKIGWGYAYNRSKNIIRRKRMDNGDGGIKVRYLILGIIKTQVTGM